MPFAEIAPTQLMRKLGGPDMPLVLDLCLPEDHALDPIVIPTARQMPFEEVPNLTVQGPVVCVCQKGRKISQGAAAHLRARGIAAEVLSGGMIAWREAGLPVIPSQSLPPQGASWVTRHRPRIDRLAVPWLLRRFVDPGARILYVPPADVPAVAARWNAIAFDHSDADLRDGDGRCTFDAVVERFHLSHDALDALADVVRAADGHGESAQAAGLLAISIGLSRQHADDASLLEAAMPLYDAMYRWARDGRDETHGHT